MTANGQHSLATDAVIRVRGLRTQFGNAVIHDGLDLTVHRGEVLGVVGASGTGKSVLLKEIIGLIEPAGGNIEVLGRDVRTVRGAAARDLRRRWGVLFQDGALFSSLTVAENIEVPLKEHTEIGSALRDEIVRLKVALAGLPPDAAHKRPAELSGGMRKRAGLARALALDPDLLFLDEPTAGLDPIGAAQFDALIHNLRQSLGLTVMMVTHDLDSLYAICDRIAALIDKRTRVDTIAELERDEHPWLKEYFRGPRGRAAATAVASGAAHAGAEVRAR